MGIARTHTRLVDAIPTRDLRWLGVATAAELLLVGVHLAVAPTETRELRYLLYPFVWMNVGCWAVARTAPSAANRRRRLAATALAVGYFLTLAYATGLLGTGGHGHAHGLAGLSITAAAPGWGPRIAYVGAWGHVAIVPFRTVGYLSLSYLAYVAALDAAEAAAPGAIGLASCLSCGFPLLGPLAAALLGGATGLAATLASFSVDLSTAAFVVAVALLALRPVR